MDAAERRRTCNNPLIAGYCYEINLKKSKIPAMSKEQRLTQGTWLRKTIGWDVVEYFPEETRRLIIDWCILDKLLGANSDEAGFYDYSFAMASMYKAAEGLLWKIATELKLGNRSTVGQFFDESNIEQNFDHIKTNIKDTEVQKKVKNQLSELKDFFLRYRNDPAHTGYRLENHDSERLAANAALHNMRCLVADLLKVKAIKLPQKPEQKTDEGIDLNDIPF